MNKKILRFFSKYTLKYPRVLAYMLQASEYNVKDFIFWYRRVKNFRHVEQRGQLVFTHKSRIVFALLLIFLASAVVFDVYLVIYIGIGLKSFLYVLLMLLLLPTAMAYMITPVIFLVRLVVQLPLEHILFKKTQKILLKHKGLKIAIAGSYGKTTTREILNTVLSSGRKVATVPHSYNTPLGINKFAHSLKGDEQILIFEFGEHYPGDILKLCRLVEPDLGIITGVNEAHLERFKTIEKTTETIFELADYLQHKPIYVNVDNDIVRGYSRGRYIHYGLSVAGNYTIQNQNTGLNGTSFDLVRHDRVIHLKSGLLGLHHIGPLVLAVNIAESIGMTIEEIEKGVSLTKSFKHRLEYHKNDEGVIILDDSYNGNPDGVKAVIDFLKSLKGNRMYVTPGLVEMGDRTEGVHIQIGRLLAEANIEKVVLVRNSVTPFIEKGLESAGFKGRVIKFDNSLSCLRALPDITVSGDIVLLQNDWPDQYQ